MQTYPLRQWSLDEAIAAQFRLVDAIHRHFTGFEIIQDGDYGRGIEPTLGRPKFTAKVEQTLADFLEALDLALVNGAGTGALRTAFMAALHPGDTVLVHDAPLYPTTESTFRAMAIDVRRADFNSLDALRAALRPDVKVVHTQFTRPKMDDSYDLAEVVAVVRSSTPSAAIISDDNYAVMRVPRIATQLGADLSCFSLYKLLSEFSIGALAAGTERGRELVLAARELNDSGGMRVQGPHAMRMLRSLVYTPVALAVQAGTVDELARRLNAGEVTGVRQAFVANSNSRCVIVELAEPIAAAVLDRTWRYGAERYPSGSESWVEINALIHEAFEYFKPGSYSLTRERGDYYVRINPGRSGPDTVIRVLREALRDVQSRNSA